MAKPDHKLDRKRLRRPDEFVTFWKRVGDAVAARRTAFAAGVVVLFVVVAGSLGLGSWRERSLTRTSQAFARISKIAAAELIPAEGEPPRFEDGVPHFKTEKERRQAALAEVESFLLRHGRSSLRGEALLLKGAFLLDLGRSDEAITAYVAALNGAVDKRLRFLAQEGLGYAHETKGDLAKATEAFDRLAQDSEANGNFYRDRAFYHRGRLAERRGEAKEAERIYREALEKNPTSSLRDELSTRLAILEAR